MQSEEQKILRLIRSLDEENKNLGQLALLKNLKESNVIFWYLELETIRTELLSDVKTKMTELLGWSVEKLALENLDKIMSFIQSKEPSPLVINKFFNYYNQYLYSLLSQSWQTQIKSEIKNQIHALNGEQFSTESIQDL